MKAVFCIAVLVFGMLVAPLNSFAEVQVLPTDKGTVKVGLSTDPANPSPGAMTLKIDFLNPQSGAIQEHIDYVVTISKDGKAVFGPIPLTHTSVGAVKIPVELKEKGEYKVTVDVEGILFVPTSEKVTFSLMVGQSGTTTQPAKSDSAKPSDTKASDKNTKPGTTGKVSVKIDTKKKDSKADTKANAKAKADAKAKAKKIITKSAK